MTVYRREDIRADSYESYENNRHPVFTNMWSRITGIRTNVTIHNIDFTKTSSKMGQLFQSCVLKKLVAGGAVTGSLIAVANHSYCLSTILKIASSHPYIIAALGVNSVFCAMGYLSYKTICYLLDKKLM